MGRKELVLINLAPASSPCLLTGLFSLSFSHLPSRCAPSLQVELLLHFFLLVLVLLVRREGVLLDLSDGDGVEKRLRFRRQHAILLVARARPDLVGALATRGLLQAWRYLEGFSLTH